LDYSANFEDFMNELKEGQPFCFWYGGKEPHRSYEDGSGLRSGKKPDAVRVPQSIPDVADVRGDILDYYLEIEWYDEHFGRMLKLLKGKGQLDNTLIVVTSDNGMPFPRAKTHLYDLGVRMPLAVRWPAKVKGGRVVDDFISHTDFAPTFLEAAGIESPEEMTGRSLLNILLSDKSGRLDPSRDKVFTAIERHSVPTGYPRRAIRTHDWLYIRNYEPDRWPGGKPQRYGDCDGSPTKTYIIEHKDDPKEGIFFQLAFAKRPSEELYDVNKDPCQIHNLAEDAAFADIKKMLREQLEKYQRKTKDPRIEGKSPWDNY